jgi:hypothetical protein
MPTLPQYLLRSIAAVSCLSICPTALAGTPVFDSNWSHANRNVLTNEGRAFDADVAAALGKDPSYAQQVSACIQQAPSVTTVIGYFYFTADSSYQVVLAPKSIFSDCLKKVHENRILPSPPRAPYAIPLTFTPPR